MGTPNREAGDTSLTLAEVAAYCRVSRTTVYRWTGSQALPYIRQQRNGHKRIRVGDLIRFIDQHA